MKTLSKYLILPMALLFLCGSSSCEKEIQRPEVTSPLMPDKGPEGTSGTIGTATVKQYTVFTAGAGNEVFRIPSVVTAKDNSIIVFAEDRHNSWRDKSYTDVVCKRSTNGGESWSAAINITGTLNSGEYAFMDPTPVVDTENGKIFIFFTRWNKLNADPKNNRAFMSVSTDNGISWSTPTDMTDEIIAPDMFSSGFGPGHGIMISEGDHKGRLVVITRQSNGSKSAGYAIYSDDHGNTWKYGVATSAAESQIAEIGKGHLYMNLRSGSNRTFATSTDGGYSWTTPNADNTLPIVEGGCEASVLGVGNDMLFYCGPESGPAISGRDNRYGLKLFRSAVGGAAWTRKQVLFEMASGYSDMTLLGDGKLAVIFEAGPEKGFIKAANREPGWMRLDFMVLPAEITDYNYWF